MSLRSIVPGACALLAGLVLAAPAQADIINTTFDVPSETTNCETGETVLYTQTYHVVARTEIVDGEETLVELMRFDPREARGVGVESGDHYQIKTNQISRDAANPLTINAQFRVINTGPGADFMLSEVFHTTYDANGGLVVSHTSANVRCGDMHEHVNVHLP